MGKSIHALVRDADVDGLRSALAGTHDARGVANQPDEYGYPPLFIAISTHGSNLDLTRTLVEHGAEIEFSRVHETEGLSRDLLGQMSDEFEEEELDFMAQGSRTEEPLNRQALKSASIEVIQYLESKGMDIEFQDDNGYTALHDCSYRSEDDQELMDYLLLKGLDMNAKTSYGETPIATCYRNGKWRMLSCLLRAGASEAPLEWNPLIKAATVGSASEMRELLPDADLQAKDCAGQPVLDVVLKRRDKEKWRILRSLVNEQFPVSDQSLEAAVESGERDFVEQLVELGVDPNMQSEYGEPPLEVAACNGDAEMVRLLLRLGANPNHEDYGETALTQAANREVADALLESGADPRHLKHEARRNYLGLGEQSTKPLDECSPEEYFDSRYIREGQSNPDKCDRVFQRVMISAGVNSYQPRKRFEDDHYGEFCSLEPKSEAVWCFDRFGQSLTPLRDGRIVLIGGEHEDYYDPDFCIYNDVTVFEESGQFTLYQYPFSVFEPTDFHTATLAEGWIYIIGGLGYPDQRKGAIPVYRLSTDTFSIESIEPMGEVPPRIHGHRAELIGDSEIRIWAGKAISFEGDRENHVANDRVWVLDLSSHTWSAE